MAKANQIKRNANRALKLADVKAGSNVKALGRQRYPAGNFPLNPHGVTTLAVGKKGAKVIRRSGRGSVIEQRVYGPDGRLKTVYTIDSGSATFGSDLGYAFKKSVAKARRENTKKLGAADAIIRKG